jgi:nucleoid-associated protein YgaU
MKGVASHPPDTDAPGGIRSDPPPVTPPIGLVPPTVPATPKRTYAVQAGDTLIKIAKKYYGVDNATQYKLILQANRESLKNETSLTVGQSLVIPDLPAPAAVAAGGEPGVRTMTPEELRRHLGVDPAPPPLPRTLDGIAGGSGRSPSARTPTSGPATAEVAGKTYVVRPGDSLAKIARLTMRDDSPAAIQKIMSANKDRISNPRTLQVGLKLEIPRQG